MGACYGRRFSVVGFASLMILTFGCRAEPGLPPRDVDELVQQQVGTLISRGKLIGAVVGVIVQGESHTYYLGATCKGGTAPDEETLYEIGSITKVMTATLLAQQQLDGVLSSADRLQLHLPDGATAPTFNGGEITLMQMANHSSGLPRLTDDLSGPLRDPYRGYTREQMLSFLSRHTLRRAPGVEYEYSNFAVGLLGILLADQVGKAYEPYLNESLFAPLGMADSAISMDSAQRENLAQGYLTAFDAGIFTITLAQGPWDLGAYEAAGAVKSTLPDMMKFLAAAMGEDTPLRQAMALAQTSTFTVTDELGVGLCWHISTTPATGRRIIWHNGGTGGFSTFLGFDPDADRGVVILANTSSSTVDPAAIAILDGIGNLEGE